jgi:hypothetical protein
MHCFVNGPVRPRIAGCRCCVNPSFGSWRRGLAGTSSSPAVHTNALQPTPPEEIGSMMKWLVVLSFVVGAALSWGVYV